MKADIHAADVHEPNPKFIRVPRKKGEDNLGWLERQLKGYGGVAIVLAGGRNNLAFHVRTAQAHQRFSFTPSHWSHAFLLLNGTKDGRVYEISLEPAEGFGFPGGTNAMQEGPLSAYQSVSDWPNIAVIRLHAIDVEEAKNAVRLFSRQRAVLDAVSLLVRWLAYAWGAGSSANPILEGHGLPSAAMIEAVCNACGYDIAPTTPSRSSTPESIWQSTKWWYHAPRTAEDAQEELPEGGLPASLPTGAFFIEHELGDTREQKWSDVLE